jgi:20S proteasome alpha/beta subunit
VTVAIGLVCADGVVAASDSMATSGGIAKRGPKLNALTNLPVVWTASGSVYVIEDVAVKLKELDDEAGKSQTLRDAFTKPDLDAVRGNLGRFVRNAMTECYMAATPGQQMLQGQGGEQRHPFGSDFLLLGRGEESAYFLEVSHDVQLNWHHAERFYAVGSGGEFASVAHALMAHYVEGEPLPVDLGLEVAYRTIATTIEVSSQWVGFPVQLAVADKDGARVLDTDQVEQVKAAVQSWIKVEADTLRRPVPSQPLEEPPSLEAEPKVPKSKNLKH